MNITAENYIELKDGLVCRVNKDGSIIVMKMNDDDLFYKVNGVAADMWQKFSDKKIHLGHIVNDLSKEYSIPVERIVADAQSFLNKAIELDFIRIT
jgi:hypothetical protein